jgi:hypothetical protein
MAGARRRYPPEFRQQMVEPYVMEWRNSRTGPSVVHEKALGTAIHRPSSS